MSSSNSSNSSNKTIGSLGADIYSDTASFGKVWAWISAIFISIIGLPFLIGGIYIAVRKIVESRVSGAVKSINGSSTGQCQQQQNDGNNTQYSCTITVGFTFQGKDYTQDISYQGSQAYIVGQQVPVYVDNNDPSQVSLTATLPRWVGFIMIAVVVVLVSVSWLWVYLSSRYKAVAAVEGAAGITRLFKTLV